MVEYRWKNHEPVKILDMELAEFDLTNTEYRSEEIEYVAGKLLLLLQCKLWSCPPWSFGLLWYIIARF